MALVGVVVLAVVMVVSVETVAPVVSAKAVSVASVKVVKVAQEARYCNHRWNCTLWCNRCCRGHYFRQRDNHRSWIYHPTCSSNISDLLLQARFRWQERE